jgi:hypothetical protein
LRDTRIRPRRALQVRRHDKIALKNRQAQRDQRLDPKWQPETPRPVLGGAFVRYEISQQMTAIVAGGIGLVTQLVKNIGLTKAIDKRLHVLKRHQPYHESDHVLSLAYNIVAGGHCIDCLKGLRQNVGYLDALGARRIPDATTAGDFLRRFTEPDVIELMEAKNDVRRRIWQSQPKSTRRLALIDVDGTIVPTLGVQKEGADFSYNGKYGYGPLVVSLANSQEVLYVVNRPANRPSHDGATPWMDRAIEFAYGSGFDRVRLRGDTAFSLTGNFDSWSDRGVEFVFGIDAHRTFVKDAEDLDSRSWKRLRRRTKREIAADPDRNLREKKVMERGFKNYRLLEEHFAEFPYESRKTKKVYRMVVLRKRIHVLKGQQPLEDEIRYFFYVTNVSPSKLSAKETIFESNSRCNQENLIEQLKNGVNATQMPSYDFMANWAYMVIGALAWDLKIWLGLTLPNCAETRELLRMEYRRFVRDVITFSAQIVKTGRSLVFRAQGLTKWTNFILGGSDWFRQRKRRPA